MTEKLSLTQTKVEITTKRINLLVFTQHQSIRRDAFYKHSKNLVFRFFGAYVVLSDRRRYIEYRQEAKILS